MEYCFLETFSVDPVSDIRDLYLGINNFKLLRDIKDNLLAKKIVLVLIKHEQNSIKVMFLN